jgi:hypothetical protein
MATITAANAIITLTIPQLFPAPQQLIGFAADDIFNTQQIAATETIMGVDGVLSGGFTFREIKQEFTLQADSASNAFFDAWYNAQQTVRDAYIANGQAIFSGISTKFAMIRGFLTSYTPAPSVGKLLKPRKYEVTWQTVTPTII